MLTQSELKKVLNYNPETGKWTWKKTGHRISKNMVAGTPNSNRGYIRIAVNDQRYLSSRLAWLYMTGSWPKHYIDHIDRDPWNDKWSNLREANTSENRYNAKMPKTNTSGVKGVSWNKIAQKWWARIGCDGKSINLGFFTSLAEAAKARQDAEIKYHKEFRARA